MCALSMANLKLTVCHSASKVPSEFSPALSLNLPAWVTEAVAQIATPMKFTIKYYVSGCFMHILHIVLSRAICLRRGCENSVSRFESTSPHHHLLSSSSPLGHHPGGLSRELLSAPNHLGLALFLRNSGDSSRYLLTKI